jgi:hypothetical protein
VLVKKHVRGRAGRRPLAAVDRADDARTRVVIHHESAAADAGTLRLDEAEHRLDGHRGIDSFAAFLENLDPRLGRQRIGGDDRRRPLVGLGFGVPMQSRNGGQPRLDR